MMSCVHDLRDDAALDEVRAVPHMLAGALLCLIGGPTRSGAWAADAPPHRSASNARTIAGMLRAPTASRPSGRSRRRARCAVARRR
jgi:hypothetical protein